MTTQSIQQTCKDCGESYSRAINAEVARLFGTRNPNSAFIVGTGQCDRCNAAERDRAAEAERRRQQSMRAAKFERRCPSRYADSDVARLRREAGLNADKVLGWQYGADGLLLGGPTGRCKTRLAWKLIERLFVVEGHSFDWLQFHELSRAVMDSDLYHGWRERMTRAQILLIDDLGKTRFSDRLEAELFGVVEERTAWKLPLIVTTNDAPDSLKARMSADRGEPLLRRIMEYCTAIPFTA